jgi:hypothetical protein
MVSRAHGNRPLVRLVGLLGFEPRTKGFTLTGRFPFRVDYLFTLGS